MKPFIIKPFPKFSVEKKQSNGWNTNLGVSVKPKTVSNPVRSYFVVNPFTEKAYSYNFTVELPEFHTAKQMIHKHQYDSAIASLVRGKDIITNSMGEKHETVIKTEEMLGRLYFQVEKYDEALQLSNHILKITEEKLESLPERIKAYEHAIECCKMLGKTDDAIGLAGAASILCRQQSHWKDHASFLLELGSLFLVQGKLDEASKNINMAAQSMEENNVKSPHLEGALNNNWGCYYKAKGENKTADEYYIKALKSATSRKDQDLEADILSNHGEVLIELNKFSEAQSALERAVSLHTKKYSKGHEKVVTDMIHLASCCSHLEKNIYAESLLHRAEDLCEVALDKTEMAYSVKQHYRALLEECLIRNAALLEKEGRHTESLQLQERAAKVASAKI